MLHKHTQSPKCIPNGIVVVVAIKTAGTCDLLYKSDADAVVFIVVRVKCRQHMFKHAGYQCLRSKMWPKLSCCLFYLVWKQKRLTISAILVCDLFWVFFSWVRSLLHTRAHNLRPPAKFVTVFWWNNVSKKWKIASFVQCSFSRSQIVLSCLKVRHHSLLFTQPFASA